MRVHICTRLKQVCDERQGKSEKKKNYVNVLHTTLFSPSFLTKKKLENEGRETEPIPNLRCICNFISLYLFSCFFPVDFPPFFTFSKYIYIYIYIFFFSNLRVDRCCSFVCVHVCPKLLIVCWISVVTRVRYVITVIVFRFVGFFYLTVAVGGRLNTNLCNQPHFETFPALLCSLFLVVLLCFVLVAMVLRFVWFAFSVSDGLSWCLLQVTLCIYV
ncbi:hypothetical protein TbgDal_X900 [Trypanosoma brucei gambiense DAL972]|uniref:Uncharacterized protein n=1 Tax=Trypanosoma brucei gambiense (strain MHOM/CI/86/DAL972) TaxID=679716 RepID=D0A167_TRYB9|nr:hypothetical protein TbgDal_X900 [Trypanosoma brucei gambiense DAL972]CBH15009.1 hypothetical protein TbgDal_X900 [Trypanosoma brucei gambiense DAL972]|eukprot:XP_011777275.1 hypothetical protein TbgDal_X900 [Trypanosoma brucei gambiense DAL972]